MERITSAKCGGATQLKRDLEGEYPLLCHKITNPLMKGGNITLNRRLKIITSFICLFSFLMTTLPVLGRL